MTVVPFNWRGRGETLANLRSAYDVVIVGGGIIGCGTALETARRGYRVLLLEKGDLGSGTSSRSSRLIHGGLRYLKHGRVRVVWEASRERYRLRTTYPHLVRPIPFVIPFYDGEGEGPLATRLGLWLYDLLAGFRNVHRHRTLSPEAVLRLEPTLRPEGLLGGAVYYDCTTDDFRLVLLKALEAHAAGAAVLTYCPVEGLEKEEGRVVGVRFRDRLEGGVYAPRAGVVINATGPWSDAFRRLLTTEAPQRLRPTKGAHLIVPLERLAVDHAVVMRAPRDGRVVFALPWGAFALLGTTDTDFQGDLEGVWADENDVDYLLDCVNRTFPTAQLGRNDVISGFAALRPLVAEYGVSESDVSRAYRLVEEAPGLISLVGGKLTTYRPAAIRIARWVERALGKREAGRAFVAREAVSERDLPILHEHVQSVARSMHLSGAVGDHLVGAYGARAGRVLDLAQEEGLADPVVPELPYLSAEVVYGVERELAIRLEDVLVRRTKIVYEDPAHGLSAAEAVADLIAERIGWSADRKRQEIADYRELVHGMEAFREAA